ncbi:MAG: 50S ribosomal protein L24 [Candidatus Woesearchaeota archaeon]
MEKQFSRQWKASTQPRKQRKYVANAPLHLRRNKMSAHLSSSLRQQYGRRSIIIRTGDKVKVMRGNFKGREGEVQSVSYRDYTIDVSGVSYSKNEGATSYYPISPSNVVITDLDLSDSKRKKALNANG